MFGAPPRARRPTRRRRRLTVRLTAVAGGATFAAVVVFWGVTLLLVRRELRGSLDSALRQRAVAVAELAVSDPAVLDQPGALESAASGRAIAVEVLDARGRILARSLSLGVQLIPVDALARSVLARGRPRYGNLTLAGQAERLYAAPIPVAAGPASGGVVLVASTTADITATIHRLAVVLGAVGLLIALLAIAVAATSTARLTLPLRRLVGSVQEIERTADPGRRLPETGGPEELARLSGVLNRMLAALERARDGERRFLADASHELRTPVTTMLGNIDYLLRHGPDPELLEDLRAGADRLARLVDDLLTLERVGSAAVPARRVALDGILREIEAERGDPHLRLGPVEPIELAVDEDAIRRAVGNLLDNARLHGPPGGPVELSLVRDGAAARLTVRDAGPGPAPEERERVFERFWRGPGAAGRPGSGLGLSIVADVAARHGGRVELDGPAFTIVLPLGGGEPVRANSHSALSGI